MSAAHGTALVTGGTGFIGAALIDRLVAAGVPVVCLVREDGPRRARLDALPGVRTVRPAAWSAAGLERALAGAAFDAVYHLAASGVSPDAREPEGLIAGNVGLTCSLLAALAAAPPRRFIHVGSCSEYAPIDAPARLREDHPLDPPSLYGAAKASAFLCGRLLAARLGVPLVALRLFGVYGPGEAPARLVPHLLAKFAAGETPELTGGEQVRDFTFIGDVADALALAAVAPGVEVGEVYNVCSGAPARVRDLVEMVARLVGREGADLGLGRRPYRADEPMWIVGDPGRFAAATGFAPRVPLAEGLRRMAAQVDASRPAGGAA